MSASGAAARPPRNAWAELTVWRCRYPEWWVVGLVIGAWAVLAGGDLLAWLKPAGGPGSHLDSDLHTRHLAVPGTGSVLNEGATPQAAVNIVTDLLSWSVMAFAMMVPATLPAVRHVALASLRYRRRRAMCLYLGAFVWIWVGIGAAVMGTETLLRVERGARGIPALDRSTLLACALVIAAIWQVSPWKRRALAACHHSVPLRLEGWPADAACLLFGSLQARRCARSCWALMGVMVVAGHGVLLWTVAISAMVFVEEMNRGARLHLLAVPLGLVAVGLLLSA